MANIITMRRNGVIIFRKGIAVRVRFIPPRRSVTSDKFNLRGTTIANPLEINL